MEEDTNKSDEEHIYLKDALKSISFNHVKSEEQSIERSYDDMSHQDFI